MKERPILFSAPMVRAILAGNKTATRRVVKPRSGLHVYLQDGYGGRYHAVYKHGEEPKVSVTPGRPHTELVIPRCPYGQPGDRLWVRETWQSNGLNWGKRISEMRPGAGPIHYAATDDGAWQSYWGAWKPSIHMPRWASRITLEVTGLRVERLQDISDTDAVAEGIQQCEGGAMDYLANDYAQGFSPKSSFRSLWESLNGAGSWDANPWVWVVEFRRFNTEAA